jgi:acyl dehydratase
MESSIEHEGRQRFIDSIGQVRCSDWFEVTQERIDTFAKATEDFEWVHVDREAAAESRFGGTIAHGLLTLSLGPHLSRELFDLATLEGRAPEDGSHGRFSFALNYGFERVRFTSPVPVGSRVRLQATMLAVDDVPNGVQLKVEQVFEREGQEKPVCVAIAMSRLYY